MDYCNPFLLLCVLLALLSSVSAQQGNTTEQCQLYQGEVSACNTYVPLNTPIWLYQFSTYNATIQQVRTRTQQSTILGAPCAPLLIKYLCLSMLQTCTTIEGFQFGQPMCRSTCSDTLDPCKQAYEFQGQTPDCFEVDNSTAIPLFLGEGETFTYTSVSDRPYQISCTKVETQDVDVECQYPLAKTKDGKSCGILCPDPMYTEKQYKGVDILIKVLGWSSFLLSLFVSITHIADPRRRTWPGNVPYLLCFSMVIHMLFMVVIPTFANVGKPFHHHWCASRGEVAGKESANWVCVIQGLSIVYMANHSNLWLLAWSSLILYQMMKNKSIHLPFYPVGVIVCMIVYGLPLVPSIIALSLKRFGYIRGTSFCTLWINEDVTTKNPMAWSDGLYAFPAVIFCSSICLELIIIMILMYRASRNVSKWKKGEGKSNAFALEAKMLQYLAYNLLNQAAFFALYFESQTKIEPLRKSYPEWLNCVAESTNHGDDCKLENKPAFATLVIGVIAASSYAGIGVFVFRMHTHVWNFWKPKLLKGVGLLSTTSYFDEDSRTTSVRMTKATPTNTTQSEYE